MKIFTAVQTQWSEWKNAVNQYISTVLGKDSQYGPSNIFGQLLTILDSSIQNLMLYIEDAFTEQNIYTAERKKSIYGLAKLSGYEPHLGSASKCSIVLSYNSEYGITNTNINIPNKTKIVSNQNGLIYNIILPQESCTFKIINNQVITKHVTAVEGDFNTSTFISEGGQLYTINVQYVGDIDINYTTVWVNGQKWERVDSLYDMKPNSQQYYISSGLDAGIDIIFGNGQYGQILNDSDTIKVEYLTHNGELGNILPEDNITFKFSTPLIDASGKSIDGNTIFNIQLEDRSGITSGTYSETLSQVKNMIGYNSRSLVLADVKNYKLFLDRFSFVGYSRCWSEQGSLVVNAMIMKNYKQLCESGKSYFGLNEDDFLLNTYQQESIQESIIESKQQIAGTVLNFINPVIKKYAMFVYLRMKSDVTYDEEIINDNIKDLIGDFFGDIQSDIFIPKSDIIHLIKSNISQIDGIDIYFIGEDNEKAKHQGVYVDQKFIYDPINMTYNIIENTITVSSGIDPHVGFDDHGNILLENDMYFPVLMGGWKYYIDDEEITVNDKEPVTIIYQ